MARTLVIADQLFERLSSTAHSKGLSTVEDLLVKISGSEPNAERRQGVAHVRALRQRLHGKYGEMSDSTELVREDRAR